MTLVIKSLVVFFVLSLALSGDNKRRDLQGDMCGGWVDYCSNCFSSFATVRVLGRGTVAMKDLQAGDEIWTGLGYEKVYAFAHRNTQKKASFLKLHTHRDISLEITGDHLLYVEGKSDPVPAESIRVGDRLLGASGEEQVVKTIDFLERKGVYAPLTSSGNLVVDNLQVSSYVALPIHGAPFHHVAHRALSPFRLMCEWGPAQLCQASNEEGMPQYVGFVLRLAQWLGGWNVAVQAALLQALLLFLTPFVGLEFLLTQSLRVSWALPVFGMATMLLLKNQGRTSSKQVA